MKLFKILYTSTVITWAIIFGSTLYSLFLYERAVLVHAIFSLVVLLILLYIVHRQYVLYRVIPEIKSKRVLYHVLLSELAFGVVAQLVGLIAVSAIWSRLILEVLPLFD